MPQGINETYAETKARQKANSLKEQLEKFRKTGRVTKGIARAGLGVQAQDYVVRTNDNPWTIARSLLGPNASESGVGALAQSILAANGGTFRPVVAGETLKIPGLSVPRGAAPSRYFMNNAGGTTGATGTQGSTGSQASAAAPGVGNQAGVTGLNTPQLPSSNTGIGRQEAFQYLDRARPSVTPSNPIPQTGRGPGPNNINPIFGNIAGGIGGFLESVKTGMTNAPAGSRFYTPPVSAGAPTGIPGQSQTQTPAGGEVTPTRDAGWNSRAAAWAFDSRVRAIRNQVAYADSIGNRQYLPVTMDGDNAAAIVATSPEYQAALTENGFTPDGQGLLEFYGYEFNPTSNTYVRLDTASSNGGSSGGPLYDTRVWMPTGVRFVRQRPSRGQSSGGARYTTSGRGNVDYQGGYGSGGLVDWSIGFNV